MFSEATFSVQTNRSCLMSYFRPPFLFLLFSLPTFFTAFFFCIHLFFLSFRFVYTSFRTTLNFCLLFIIRLLKHSKHDVSKCIEKITLSLNFCFFKRCILFPGMIFLFLVEIERRRKKQSLVFGNHVKSCRIKVRDQCMRDSEYYK